MWGSPLLLLAAAAVTGASLPSQPGLAFAGATGGLRLGLRPACSSLSAFRPAHASARRPARFAHAVRMSSMFTEDSNGEISVTPLWEDSLDDLDGMNITPGERERLLKARSSLFTAVAGLERGSSATRQQRSEVDLCVKELERCLPYSPSIWPDCIQGRWRLIYSSALSPGSGSGGGASKDSPIIFQTPDAGMFIPKIGPLSPIDIGTVWQNIDLNTGELDNIVDVNLQVPLVNAILPQTTSTARCILRHQLSFEPDYARRVKIVLSKLKMQYAEGPIKAAVGTVGLKLPELTAPVLTQVTELGPGIFDTTYCDDEVRISKGDRGELRVFVRDR